MQDLYKALIALGKSYEDAHSGGWICGALCDVERPKHPKCINGLLTWHTVGVASYISSVNTEYAKALHMAAVALIKTSPENVREEIMFNAGEITKQTLISPEDAAMAHLENLLIEINDQDDPITTEPLLTSEMAAAWFERAFDLLAQELPEPISALYVPGNLSPVLIST